MFVSQAAEGSSSWQVLNNYSLKISHMHTTDCSKSIILLHPRSPQTLPPSLVFSEIKKEKDRISTWKKYETRSLSQHKTRYPESDDGDGRNVLELNHIGKEFLNRTLMAWVL